MKSIIISGANSKERELSLSALSCIRRKYVHPLWNVLRMTTWSKHKTMWAVTRLWEGKKKKKRMEWSSLETGQVVSLQCRHLLYLWMRWWRFQCTQEGHGLDFSTVETVIGWSFWYLTELHVYSGMQQQGSLCFLFTVPFLVVIWHLVDHARPWTVSSQALSHKNRALIMLFH